MKLICKSCNREFESENEDEIYCQACWDSYGDQVGAFCDWEK